MVWINANNNSNGDSTICAFLEIELLGANEILFCKINRSEYECHIKQNENDRYVWYYQDQIKEGNLKKFIHQLSIFMRIRIRPVRVTLNRIHRASNNQTLFMLSFDLRKKLQID